MRARRQPSGQFLRRLKGYSEHEVKPLSRIRKYKESDAWLWTEVAAVVVSLAFVIPTAIAIWVDLEDRQSQRVALAWETVTRVAPGNSGKGPALEYLNNQGIKLVGVNLSAEYNQGPSYLSVVKLPKANLYKADLSGADLFGANLSGADLFGANLSRANLRGATLLVTGFSNANLSGAFLGGANLSGAFLVGTDLSGADLLGANLFGAKLSEAILSEVNLSRADLRNVEKLSQKQLNTACGDAETKLPEGLTIKTCPEL